MKPALLSVVLALAVAGCGRGDSPVGVTAFDTRIVGAEPAPPEAVVTDRLDYEAMPAFEDRVARLASSAVVDVPAGPGKGVRLIRIAHATDAQIREERARLLVLGTPARDLPSFLESPVEPAVRPPLLAANTPFVWLGWLLTVNELHRTTPVDLVIHTGDATDVNLASELERFLRVAQRSEPPFLLVAGNHDVRGWGVWPRDEPVLGTELDEDVELATPEVAATFAANGDRLILSETEHLDSVAGIVSRIGVHLATLGAFGSRLMGYDLGPPGTLYYTRVLAPPVPGVRPGVQLVVLETTRDEGGPDAGVGGAQLAWLGGVLDDPATQENVVVVAAHHPLVRRGQPPLLGIVPVGDLDEVRELLLAHPNVALYLTGHTHDPDVAELYDAGGSLAIAQLNPGSLLLAPQTGSIVELSIEGEDLVIEARRFGPAVNPGTPLGQHVGESRAATSIEDSPADRAEWETYRAVKRLPPGARAALSARR